MKSRREFLTSSVALVGSVALGSIVLPILQSCGPNSIPPAPVETDQTTDGDGRVAVDVSAITPANPMKRIPGLLGPDGKPVMVTLTSDGKYHAFSMLCTHQAGILNSTLSNGQIVCPVHNSHFTLNGVPEPGSLATQRLTEWDSIYDPAAHSLRIKIA
jgi:Rieske Fe-S protein